ncbi:hypothetical protein Pmani_020416 [Petrolisthes manimaculis]|uniref:Uncharacterized protein n=1 Tax=Petrolisthes manimaculis TaxID=1843537 RepID=A0AAE1U335_9EUCA|nr:hypothetical protein Pmani_020416 [Petrolisthes manimaculis]
MFTTPRSEHSCSPPFSFILAPLPSFLLPRTGSTIFLPTCQHPYLPLYSLVLAPLPPSLLSRPGTPTFLPPYSLVLAPPSVSTPIPSSLYPRPGTPTFLSTRQHPSLPLHSLPSSPLPLDPDTPYLLPLLPSLSTVSNTPLPDWLTSN